MRSAYLVGRGEGIKIFETGQKVKLITKAVELIRVHTVNNNIAANSWLAAFLIRYLLFDKHVTSKVRVNYYE